MNTITIQKSLIEQAISNMQSAITKKNAIDITSNISLETVDNKLILKATDHEIYIRITLQPDSMQGNLKCAINGELISNVMKSLNDSEIILEETEEILFIKQNRSVFKIPIFEINDFPFNQDFKTMEKIDFDNIFLLQSIKKVLHCCNEKDSFNIAMQGISLDIKNNKLSIVATDSKRLGYVQKNHQDTIKPLSCIIHKKTINEILKLFNNEFEVYIKRMSEDDKIETIGFISHDIEFYTKLINANFPDYENIINTKPKTTLIKIEKDKLLHSINQINSICSRLKITFNKDSIILETLEGINGSSASIVIDNIENMISDTITIGLVNKHIIDCLTSTKYNEIEIHIDDPNKPLFVVSKDLEEVIMPQIL